MPHVLPTDSSASAAAASDEMARRSNLARLDALHRSGLLDAPPEVVFDRITSLVCRVLRVPVSLMSLVDEARQVFKSAYGLADPWDTCREAPLAQVLCRHVVDNNAPLQIDDTARHPLVEPDLRRGELGVVSYLGVPLRTPAGLVLGALCAIGHQPRSWSSEEVTGLTNLAAMVEREIELRREFVQQRDVMQAEQYLNQSLLDSSGDCIQMLDVDGHLLYLNPTGCVLMEVEEASALEGRYWPHDWPSEAAQAAEDALARARSGDAGRFQAFCPTFKGTPKWWDVQVTAVTDEAGRAIKLLAISRDVTSAKEAENQLRESEERFRHMADHSPVMLRVARPDGCCVYLNRSWYEFTNQTPETALGFGWLEVVHPDDRTTLQAAIFQLSNELATFRLEYRMRRHDGQYRWVIDAAVPRFDAAGACLGFIASIIDMHDRRLVEEALRESETRFRTLANNIAQLAWIADASGWIVWYNQRWFDYTGTTLEDMQGWGWQKVHHPDHVDRVVEKISHCFNTGEVWEDTFPLRGHDGNYRWFLSRAFPIHDEQGRVVQWFGTNTDITEQLEAEAAMQASEAQLRLVSDHASVLLLQCDRAHRFKFVNRPYAQRFGLEPQQIIGVHIADIVGAEVYALLQSHMETALAGQRVEFEIELPYEQLGLRWMHGVYVPEWTPQGEVIGFVGVIADVTLRKRAEEALRESEERLKLALVAMERARDEALAASRAKDDFLAALSHELRTPLNPVLLLASEAVKNPHLPPEVRMDFDTIAKNVALEARLIDDLLDLTRMTRGQLVLHPYPVDIHAALQDAVATVQAELKQKQLQLSLSLEAESHTVLGDATRLLQVFWNILKNAVKFTPEGGKISVTTHVCAASRILKVEIADTGIGISPEELDRVFNAFSQGDHAIHGDVHRFGGVGLGLAISRMLVDLHQGQIYASSAGRGHGATFVIDLPLLGSVMSTRGTEPDDVQTAPLSQASEAETVAHRGRILLVEDHQPTRRTLTRLLTRRRYEVTAAASVAEAHTCASQSRFDLVISDIGLPDGDGYTLMADLRLVHPDLIGIALSGYGMEEDLSRSRNAGFATHLIKPIQIGDLERVLADILPAAETI